MKKESGTNGSIKYWATDEQPREKMIQQGAAALSNAELLAILIRSGTPKDSALELARRILQMCNQNLDELGKLSLKSLQQIKGIGDTKALSITAAIELGRRRQSAGFLEKPVIKSSNDIASYLRVVLKDYPYEVFAVVFLNRANKINHFEIISKGGITGTVADPRIIMKKALEEEATSIVLSHNHPSGNLKPSLADEDLTHKIKNAASLFDIKVLDHIIVSDEGYFSFADEGIM